MSKEGRHHLVTPLRQESTRAKVASTSCGPLGRGLGTALARDN